MGGRTCMCNTRDVPIHQGSSLELVQLIYFFLHLVAMSVAGNTCYMRQAKSRIGLSLVVHCCGSACKYDASCGGFFFRLRMVGPRIFRLAPFSSFEVHFLVFSAHVSAMAYT